MDPQTIIDYFTNLDKNQGNIIHDTEKGIFGVSDLNILKSFFEQIKPHKDDVFIDLGSGDGRVAILASYYCKAIGIEFDNNLHKQAREHNTKLQTTAQLLNQDYESYNYEKATILFSFADHFFTEEFIEQLKKQFKGTLYIYQGVFTPNLKKGKTIWINQVPILSYPTLFQEH